MKLLSMKVPAHLRLVKFWYDNCGNLKGLKTAYITADSMFSRYKKVCLNIALRRDEAITEVAANQQWVHFKAHPVNLERYYKPKRLDQI